MYHIRLNTPGGNQIEPVHQVSRPFQRQTSLVGNTGMAGVKDRIRIVADIRAQVEYCQLRGDDVSLAGAPVVIAELDRLGNRGYRVAQLEASISAGRLYLGAYALRLGATGLTFFDDAVTEFFSPHAKGKSAMFLVAIGKRARRR